MDPRTKEILQRPFESHVIRERIGPGGRPLSYVPVGHYIARLNESFDEWSFEITETRVLDDEVIVHVRLTAGGMTKMGIGGTVITRRKDSRKPVSLAHDVMAAEANALKRACRLLGIGAALYLDEDDAPPPANSNVRRESALAPRDPRAFGQGASGQAHPSPRITNAQLGKLRTLVAETGMDWHAYRSAVREQHGTQLEYLDRRLASQLIEELISRESGAANGNGHWRAQ